MDVLLLAKTMPKPFQVGYILCVLFYCFVNRIMNISPNI